MTDLDDLRRRAAQMAAYGNYWPGKCVGLIDRVRSLKRERDDLRRLVADAHREHPGSIAWCEVTGGMAAALDNALDAVAVADATERAPSPHPTPSTGEQQQ